MAREIEYRENMAGNFRLLNFATGSYTCFCSVCKQSFIGDKRAVQCLGCALKLVVKKFTSTNKAIAKLPDWDEIRNALPPAPAEWGTDEETAEACMEYGAQSAYEFIVRQLRMEDCMPVELLPCCGCGGIAEVLRDATVFFGQSYADRYPPAVADQTHGFQVRCAKCGLQTCWWHYKQEAINHWNQRAQGEAVATAQNSAMQATPKPCPHYTGETDTPSGDIPRCNHPDVFEW